MLSQEIHFRFKDSTWAENKGMEKVAHANGNPKRGRMAI